MKILGDNLRATNHVAELIIVLLQRPLCSLCALFARPLRCLLACLAWCHQSYGCLQPTLCAPAWWVFAMAEDRNRLEQFLNRTRRMGYLPSDSLAISEMVRQAEDKLLSAVRSNQFRVPWHS